MTGEKTSFNGNSCLHVSDRVAAHVESRPAQDLHPHSSVTQPIKVSTILSSDLLIYTSTVGQ